MIMLNQSSSLLLPFLAGAAFFFGASTFFAGFLAATFSFLTGLAGAFLTDLTGAFLAPFLGLTYSYSS